MNSDNNQNNDDFYSQFTNSDNSNNDISQDNIYKDFNNDSNTSYDINQTNQNDINNAYEINQRDQINTNSEISEDKNIEEPNQDTNIIPDIGKLNFLKKRKLFKIAFSIIIFLVTSIITIMVLATLKIIKLPWLEYPEILNLSQNEVMLKKDSNFQFSSYVYPSQVKYGKIIYESSDPSVADINPITGYVDAKQNGVTTIKAYLEDYSSIYDTCNLVVSNNDVMVESIEVDRENVDILVGNKYQLKYHYSPNNAGVHYFSYTSSDPSIVTVDSKGEVTAVKEGKAAINILEEASGIMTHQEFTVYNKKAEKKDSDYVVSNIKLSSTDVVLNLGGEYQVQATVYPEDIVQSLSWSSLNNSIVTVSDNGLIKAIDYGETQVLVTAIDGTNKIIKVKVEENEVLVNNIKFDKSSIEIKQGETKKLSVIIEPSDATDQKVLWSSTDTSIVTVNNSGVIEGVSVGSANIIATSSNGKTSSLKVTVSKIQNNVKVTNIKLSQTSLTMNSGSSVNIKAEVVPSNATNKKLTWSSSNTNIVTVSNGMIYAKSVGNATVTVTNSNISKEIKVSVLAIDVDSISLNQSSVKLGIGGETKLYVTFKPTNATDKRITWLSSNSSIATVTSDGRVTAKSIGDVNIIAKTTNGKTVTCKVKVTNESIPVSSLKLSSNKYIVKVNSKVGITPIISPNNATNQKVSYKVSNSNIAQVQSDGTIKGIKEGIVQLTATAANGKTATSYVIVKNKNSSINYLDGSTIKYWYDNTYGTYAITHIWVKDAYKQFKLEMPDKFGTLANPKSLTLKALKKNSGKTIISINASGFVTENFSKALYQTKKEWKNTSVSPIVIYEGKLIRDYTTIDLPHTTIKIYGMDKKGNLVNYKYSAKKVNNNGIANKMLNDGVKYSFGWYPLLIYNGTVTSNLAKDNNIRQSICQIDSNNFLYITNISSNRSKGFSPYSLANKMKELGCVTGFNLDGGGSTSIYYVKKGASSPTKIKTLEGSNGRSIPDIIYFVGD